MMAVLSYATAYSTGIGKKIVNDNENEYNNADKTVKIMSSKIANSNNNCNQFV